MIWLESPSNPLLKVIDILAVVAITKKFNKEILVANRIEIDKYNFNFILCRLLLTTLSWLLIFRQILFFVLNVNFIVICNNNKQFYNYNNHICKNFIVIVEAYQSWSRCLHSNNFSFRLLDKQFTFDFNRLFCILLST